MIEYFSKTFYNLIVRPRDAMEEVSRGKPWVLVFMIFVGAHVSRIIGGALSLPISGGFGRAVMVFGLGFGIAAGLLNWIVVSGVFHLSAELWKVKGNAGELFMMLGVCMAPGLFVAPLSIIARGMGGASLFFYSLFILGINVWMAVLSIMAIKKVYSCSMEKALRIFFVPLFFVFVVSMFLTVVIVLVIAAV